MLPRREYIFDNIDEENFDSNNTFYFYCDNMQEGIHILFWLEQENSEMHLIKRGYNGISRYISQYEVEKRELNIVICSYYHNGELPREVRQMINKIDKPDVVIYSMKEEKIICGIENTQTCFAGNATWQRHGRIMNFLDNKFPFIFFAYYTKLDKSKNNIRKPSPLFVFSFISLSLEKSTPAIISLFEHEDPKQNILNADGNHPKDMRKEALKYILSLMLYGYDAQQSKESLSACIEDMRQYYERSVGRVKEREIPAYTLNQLRNPELTNEITESIYNHGNIRLFIPRDCSFNYLFPWSPKSNNEFVLNNEHVGIRRLLDIKLGNIEFYELSPNCPAGITFITQKLINRLSEIKPRPDYYWEDSLDETKPTIIILLRLTKNGRLELPDPYNGRIPAFYEMYKQSFGDINCMIMLIDHSDEDEYTPTDARGMKIYKSINDYGTIFIDRDFNVFDKTRDRAQRDLRARYEENVTEDNVTCFFETILMLENIKESFINPPCGSWSDFRLYPTDKFLYINRDDDRPDIAYYIPDEQTFSTGDGTYYVGESKASYMSFRSDHAFNQEVQRIHRLIESIKSEITLEIEYKTFVIFAGTKADGETIVEDIRAGRKEKADYVAIIEENNELANENIKMIILEV